MIKFYLKTNTEQEMWEALEAANLAVRDYDPTDENNIPTGETDWTPTGAYDWRFTGYALDMIGTIYTDSDQTKTDEFGNEVPIKVAVDGFHANLKAPHTVTGLPTVDTPATPYRVWVGE